MFGKFVYLLVFSAFIATVANSEPIPKDEPHNLVVGAREFNDRLIHIIDVVKEALPQEIVTEEQLFKISRYWVINLVAADDKNTDGHGAYPSLVQGGPGFSNVTLRFESQRSHGIDFKVKIYGKRRF